MEFTPNLIGQPPERQLKQRLILVASVFTLLVTGVSAFAARVSYLANHTAPSTSSSEANVPVFSSLRRLMIGEAGTQTSSTRAIGDQMNILILGIGGAGHDGSNLTDTILLASVDLKQKKVGLVSIPRDLAYPLGEGRFEKINAVHAYAEQDYPGEGAKKTAEAFSSLLETPIDHVVRLDFRGFTDLIDAVGGITVNVETSFTDPSYPSDNPPNSWKTISFKKGPQLMNGDQALTFTRSRHGNNGEGSDFARSRRQQLVLLALRDKLLSLNTLGDPAKLAHLYSAISRHLQSDLSVWDLLKFAPLAGDFSRDHITLNTLTDAPGGLLNAGTVAGAYMLFPKNPDWSDIRRVVQHPFENDGDRTAEKKPVETIRLEVKNGTTRTNFAAQVAARLEKTGYEITGLGNAQRRGFDQTVIYDLTDGKKPAELARLKTLLQADVVTVNGKQLKPMVDNPATRLFPIDSQTTERVYSQTTDFLLILGEASFSFVNSTP